MKKLAGLLLAGTMILCGCEKSNNDSDDLELVFSDNTYQFTGLTKEDGGRLFVNYPKWSPIHKYDVVQATGDTSYTPYPNADMNNWKPGEPGQNKWVCVQSVYLDKTGTLWVLDPAAPMMKTIQGNGAKLVRMNKANNTVDRTYSLMSVLPDTAYANDVRVDTERQFAYITESKGGGIIVVDLNTGLMRRLLSTHYSTKSDPTFTFVIDGRELMKEGKPVKINSDGIALTPDFQYLYYKPLTDDKLYRIKTEFLRNWIMTDQEMGAKVEDLGHFTTTDGMIFDNQSNLYLGDLQNYRLVRIDPNQKMTILIQDNKLIWPDSYSISDGYLYLTCSQINKQPEYNNGANLRTTPYSIFRYKL